MHDDVLERSLRHKTWMLAQLMKVGNHEKLGVQQEKFKNQPREHQCQCWEMTWETWRTLDPWKTLQVLTLLPHLHGESRDLTDYLTFYLFWICFLQWGECWDWKGEDYQLEMPLMHHPDQKGCQEEEFFLVKFCAHSEGQSYYRVTECWVNCPWKGFKWLLWRPNVQWLLRREETWWFLWAHKRREHH